MCFFKHGKKVTIYMLRAYKTEIAPVTLQAMKIHQTIGVCRFAYNFYIAQNKAWYAEGKRFVSANAFSVWLNNEYLQSNPDKVWIKEVGSKSVKQAFINAECAYKKFFKGEARFPQFKKKGVNDPKMYFVKNDAKHIIECERHRIKIPTLGWVRLKEYGYIPTNATIRSGAVSVRAGRYFVSVLVDMPDEQFVEAETGGIGIDVGVKQFATVSDGNTYGNINKTKEVRRLEKKLRREQRRLSRKYEAFKTRNKAEKGVATRQNIQKQRLKVQRLHYRLDCIRTDYINKSVSALVKTKPAHITIEDLNVRGMMKNRHLSKAVAQVKLSEFRSKLTCKCAKQGTELRVVSRWYPSSKLCHECGRTNKGLKLNDRVYKCECGYIADRDFNAALNLRDAKEYSVA